MLKYEHELLLSTDGTPIVDKGAKKRPAAAEFDTSEAACAVG